MRSWTGWPRWVASTTPLTSLLSEGILTRASRVIGIGERRERTAERTDEVQRSPLHSSHPALATKRPLETAQRSQSTESAH